MPLISVVIPVYNSEKYLAHCLDSVLNQTFKDFELICVNDGSTDGSAAILEQCKNKDSRVKVINSKNNGAGVARNLALDSASGKYIAFLDSDDFFEPLMLEKSFNTLEATDSDFVVFHSDRFLNTLDSFVSLNSVQDEDIPPYRPLNYRNLNKNVFKVFKGWAWDKIYRVSFLKEHGLRFQELRSSEDLMFVFSVLVLANRFEVLPDVFVHYRTEVIDSLSNTRENSWDCFYSALLSLRSVLIKNELYTSSTLRQDFINYALHFCLWNLNSIQGSNKEKLFSKLKNEWFDELEISKEKSSFFYDKAEYAAYLKIKNNSFKKYSKFNIHRLEEAAKQFLMSKYHKNKFSKVLLKAGVKLWLKVKYKSK